MNLQDIRRYSCVTTLLISGCASAGATVVVYTDRITWQSATSNVNTIAFEGIATQGQSPVQFGSAGDTIGSVTFQGFDNTASTQPDLEVNYPSTNWGSGAVLQGPAGSSLGQHIIATLPGGVFAVGSDIMLYDGTSADYAETVTAKLSTGSTIYNAQTNSGFSSRAFIGFVSDTQISSITFFPANDPAPHLVLDNFSTGGQAMSPTPEAATMIFCGIGLLFMMKRLRRNPAGVGA